MSNRYNPRGNIPLEERLTGTQAQFKWAEWLKAHGLQRTNQIGVFRKKDISLVVYGYAVGQCGVIKKVGERKMMQSFRPWAQPYKVVRDKLIAAGWTLESEQERKVDYVH